MANKTSTSYNFSSISSSGQTTGGEYVHKPIGYADGYSNYKSKTGAHNTDGTTQITQITKQDAEEHVKSIKKENLLDKGSNKFRNIFGYGKNTNGSDDYEDPTFLIFDLCILKDESPLFRDDSIKQFIDDYSDSIPELNERNELGMWEEFVKRFFTIFPSDNADDDSGSKRHYIESITGLDVLLNPIINYPDDTITFTITEDVSMNLQYLAELYNNLVYSYETQRYLIPANLLRFNMEITIRDMRNMKILNTNDAATDVGINGESINQNVSKFIYVLHDCQFDFSKTKNFGTEIKRGGFNSPLPSISPGGIITMNFKSYSKITAPLLLGRNKSINIDLRERQTSFNNGDIYLNSIKGDYTSNEEYKEIISDEYVKNIKYRGSSDITGGISTQNNKILGGFQFPDIDSTVRGFGKLVNKEITEVRDVIIKQIYEEVNQLATEGEHWLGNKVGFTLDKTNVYYDSLEEKVTKFSYMFESFLDDKLDKILRNEETDNIKPKSENVYSNSIRKSGVSNTKSIGDLHPDGKYNQKYPEGDLAPDGKYNQKYPEGDLAPDGKYNQKYPEGDIAPDGKYNQKYPEGDLAPDGKYNQKYPEGDLAPDGKYNQKYPEGDLHPDGKYNQKYPEGDLAPDGKYNQKYPEGDVYPDGQYNQKYPEGDLTPDGKYNQKYPEGDLTPDGKYNQKYPEGDLEPDGKYNQKYPEGDLDSDGKYNEKYPTGDVYPDGKYNEKYPEGDVYPDVKINSKHPTGNIYKKNK